MSGKYSQKVLDQAKKSATDALKTFLKRLIQKAAGATGHLISNKIADAVAVVQQQNYGNFKNSQKNNSETVTNENDKEMP